MPSSREDRGFNRRGSFAETRDRESPRTNDFHGAFPPRYHGRGLSTGKNTFVTQMVELAGGRNIFDDMRLRYPIISKETLMVRHPEVVLEFKPGLASEETSAMLKRDWDALSSLPAVASGRVYVINHDDALIPGPRMAEVAEQIARVLHPELGGAEIGEVESHGN